PPVGPLLQCGGGGRALRPPPHDPPPGPQPGGPPGLGGPLPHGGPLGPPPPGAGRSGHPGPPGPPPASGGPPGPGRPRPADRAGGTGAGGERRLRRHPPRPGLQPLGGSRAPSGRGAPPYLVPAGYA